MCQWFSDSHSETITHRSVQFFASLPNLPGRNWEEQVWGYVSTLIDCSWKRPTISRIRFQFKDCSSRNDVSCKLWKDSGTFGFFSNNIFLSQFQEKREKKNENMHTDWFPSSADNFQLVCLWNITDIFSRTAETGTKLTKFTKNRN